MTIHAASCRLPAARHFSRVVGTSALVLLLAVTPTLLRATPYTWNQAGAGGDWNNAANWDPASPVPDFSPGSSDTFSLNNGDHADVGNNETFGALLTINPGSTLDATASMLGTPATASDLQFNGGTLFSSPGGNGNQRALNGSVDVTAPSLILLQSTNHRFTLNSMMTGSSGMALQSNAFPGTTNRLTLTADNSGFSGGWTVDQDSVLNAENSNALGTGAVVVGNTGILNLGADMANSIDVQAGGALSLDDYSGSGNSTVLVPNLSMNGGSITSNPGGNTRHRELAGAAAINAATRIEVNGTNSIVTIGATLTGSDLITIGSSGGSGNQRVRVTADNSSFSGGFEVGEGTTLETTHANALGTGVTVANANGKVDLGTSVSQTIQIKTGGTALVDSVTSQNSATINVTDLRLQGGQLRSAQSGNGRTRDLAGSVFVDQASSVQVHGTNHRFTLSATLHGSADLQVGGINVGFGNQQLILPTDNRATFSGDWTIDENTIGNTGGNLVVRLTDAGGFGTGGVQVNDAAVVDVDTGIALQNDISGTGTVRVQGSGAITLANSTIGPGQSLGTLTLGNGGDSFALGSGLGSSILQIEVAAGGLSDLLAVDGDLSLDNVELQLVNPDGIPGDGGPFTISTISGTQTGTFLNDSGGLVSGLTPDDEHFEASITYTGSEIVLTNVRFFADLVAVPEPTSAMAWLGMIGLVTFVTRRNPRRTAR